MARMMVIDDENGAFQVDEGVVDALRALGKALSAVGLAAEIRLTRPAGGPSVGIALGDDLAGNPRVLRARLAARGEGSRLAIDGIE
jgi:hypothetical protein